MDRNPCKLLGLSLQEGATLLVGILTIRTFLHFASLVLTLIIIKCSTATAVAEAIGDSGLSLSPTPVIEDHTIKLLLVDGRKLEYQTQTTLALYLLDSGLSVLMCFVLLLGMQKKSEDLLNIWLTLTMLEAFHYVFIGQAWVAREHELLPSLCVWGYKYCVVAAFRLRMMEELEQEATRQNLSNNPTGAAAVDEPPVDAEPDNFSAMQLVRLYDELHPAPTSLIDMFSLLIMLVKIFFLFSYNFDRSPVT